MITKTCGRDGGGWPKSFVIMESKWSVHVR